MKAYVLGFAFSPDTKRVALIRKNRPTWQAGKLNGIGGHLEANEQPHVAMVREFEEETGATVLGWKHFLDIKGWAIMQEWRVTCFMCRTHKLDELKTNTDEEVGIYDVEKLYEQNTIPNLHWIIPMALDDTLDNPITVKVVR